jgi:1-acyl-sn-glycerol-3-phosphate acyltransferase
VRTICILFFRVRVYNQNRVPAEGGVLIASNHQSYLDPILVGVGIERSISYMARRSLFRHPLFGGLIRALNTFPVERGGRDTAALREAVERLKSGWCLTVFPEGTRSHDGRIGRIHPGALLMAHRAQTPIVPAVIEGAFEAWPRHGPPRPGRILVGYGMPISAEEQSRLTRDELARRLHDDMLALQKELRGRRSL